MFGIDARAARITWTVALVVLAMVLVYLLRATLFIFVLAVLFAYLVEPLVNLLVRFLPARRTRALALALAYVVLVGVVVGASVLIGSRVVQQANELAKVFPGKVGGWMDSVQAHVPDTVRTSLANLSDRLVSALPQLGLKILGIASNLIYVVIIPVLAFFFLKDAQLIRQHILNLVEAGPHRSLLDDVLADVHLLLAHYMRVLVLLSICTFAAYSISFSILGIPYAILLGVLAGMLEFIPMVGPLAAALLVLVVAGVSGANLWGILIFLVAYRMLQDYVLSPHLMGQGVQLHPLLILFGVFGGAEIAGIAGTFLSVPVLSLARIVYLRAYRARLRLPGAGAIVQ